MVKRIYAILVILACVTGAAAVGKDCEEAKAADGEVLKQQLHTGNKLFNLDFSELATEDGEIPESAQLSFSGTTVTVTDETLLCVTTDRPRKTNNFYRTIG